MDKGFLAILILAALFFSSTGVMADDSGTEGSDDSTDDGADDSSDDSSDESMDDSMDITQTRDVSSGDSMNDSTDDISDTSMDDSADESPDATEQEAEIEIEHGIAAIMTDESRLLSSSPQAQPAIMTRSLVSLSSLPGTSPARMSELAKTVDDSYGHLSEAERSIRERSGILSFFFGGDDAAAEDIESHVNADSSALDEMERLANNPNGSPALKAFAQARLRFIRADLEHWQELAAAEKAKSGLFG